MNLVVGCQAIQVGGLRLKSHVVCWQSIQVGGLTNESCCGLSLVMPFRWEVCD